MSLRKKGGVDPCPPSTLQGPLFDQSPWPAAKPHPLDVARNAAEANDRLTWLRDKGVLIGNDVDALIRTLTTIASMAKEVGNGQ